MTEAPLVSLASMEFLRILLVEDSQTDAILIERALRSVSPHGYTIQKVETLSQALRVLGEDEFNVVLLDLSLTDTLGFNGLLSIQQFAPKLPVIILTAHQDEEMALSAVQHGAQDYLFKDRMDGQTIKRAMRYAIQRKLFEGVLITHAHFDLLTGLANRMLFESRLDMALARRARSGEGIGVFFLDLDRFKQVNDQYGHAVGDQLLQQVAERLTRSIRSYDTAARFGGDEFALIIDSIKNHEDCVAVAKKIIEKISEPFFINHKELDIGVSIGIALCLGDDKSMRDVLTKRADEAMYQAKRVPQSDYQFYSGIS